ncbi:MAG: DUF1127 domain-containing protein [Pseudomonadota bacterium]
MACGSTNCTTSPVLPISRAWRRHRLPLLLRWLQRARSRADLAALEDHMLKDIGLTREAAQREARRPFWDRH